MTLELSAKERLTQTFKFLKELNELRNPVSRVLPNAGVMRLDTWPVHPCVQVRRGDHLEEDADEAAEAGIVPLIRIQRAKLTPCPNPPESLDGWLKPGWQSADAEVLVLDSRNFQDEERQTVTIGFADDAERVVALNLWTAKREEWVDAERPALTARQLFERVHALWTTMQREGDRQELVLADGMLYIVEQSIHYPVLMQGLNLEFDPSVPEFRFGTEPGRVKLHRALLRLIPDIEGRMIAHFERELEAGPVAPLDGEIAEEFFRRLVQGLFTDGEFLESKASAEKLMRPSVWREPVIFLSPRTAGLSTMLDYIVEDLAAEETQAPAGLSRIMGVEIRGEAGDGFGGSNNPEIRMSSGFEPDILFSKPANAEQYEIAARLNKTKAVLVQGPPGTGKTHTIANLLGYLLSQGKTVLVTAHTTKALRVLRQQVDEALRALCLSVLDGDASSHAQLSHAVQEIASQLSRSDAANLRREAGLLREQRRRLLEIREELRRQLRDARFSEVEEIVIGGEGLSPIEVAKRVKENAECAGWIPGPLQVGVSCPLSESEVRQLYASQAILSQGDEAQLVFSQPVLARLVTSSDFRLLASEQESASLRAQTNRPEFWNGSGPVGTASSLQELHQRIRQIAAMLGEESHWLREVLFAGWIGGGLGEAWNDLSTAVEELAREAGAAQRLIMAHGPELPTGRPVDEVVTVLGEIVAFLESGGSLGFKTKLTRRAWHHLVDTCRVEDRVPSTLEELRALLALAQLEVRRKRFADRWRRAVENIGGPTVESLGRSPERTASGYVEEIRRRLEWRRSVWEPLIRELVAAGFCWDAWLAMHPPVPGEYGELTRVKSAASQSLVELIEAQAALLRERELSAALQVQRAYLAGFPQSDAASVLLQAQDTWDAGLYENAFRELARLEGLREVYESRLALLGKLETAAPAWSYAVRQRHKGHEQGQPPGEAASAWRWRQWFQELERRAALSMVEIQERLDRTENELRKAAAIIIEKETWAAQRERTGLQAQQALMGFVQTVRKIGKGTGKRVPELLREARKLLASARSAVPVWILPLSRVYESFDPRETRFDVVIIDEASQSDVTAMAALYLGSEHVVVGDKEQVTPDAVGQRLAEVQRLISTDLQGIPNSHLYDGQTSIYDLAEAAFGGVVALREHFRCVPEIIQFSNYLSYNGSIRPLREPFSAGVRPSLVSHRVNGFRDGRDKINTIEAEELASLVVACINESEYALNELGRPTSFGVISLLGDEQALLIESLLRQRLSPDKFEKHRLLCGSAAHFQGDERDVIFLSMVDGPPEDGRLNYRDSGPNDLYKKRYNVAVSRARNQIWLVHSLDPDTHLKAGDLRRRLIEHVRDPQALLRMFEDGSRRTDSVFETQVLQRLIAAKYRVQPQWKVGSYRIDLVVEGTARRLAVECDGERWHTPEQLNRDLERQAILERLGWVFVRIRGSVFFRDPDTAMAPVFARLEQLGIEPLGNCSILNSDPVQPLVDKVRRAAERLRQDWVTNN